jgi:hypothetical protein
LERLETSPRFRREWEIRQTDVVQKEFKVWAVIISTNCKRDVQ